MLNQTSVRRSVIQQYSAAAISSAATASGGHRLHRSRNVPIVIGTNSKTKAGATKAMVRPYCKGAAGEVLFSIKTSSSSTPSKPVVARTAIASCTV